MDLTERGAGATRHPWEVQRFAAYRRVLGDHGALGATRVLDVGAGDGWFSDRLAEHLAPDASITCWDINYDDNELEPTSPGVRRTRDRPDRGHDLVLLLDVLEHIDDPRAFLGSSLIPILEPDTPILVAVPAYQRLFSAHDVALGHVRRYGRRQLLAEIDAVVDVQDYGSLFASLLVPRAATVAFERVRPRPADRQSHGIGEWSGGRVLTGVAGGALAVDAQTGRLLGRAGVRLPGLSHWAYGVVR